MAPVRVPPPPYTTRRKRQPPTPRCTSTCGNVVVTTRSPDAGYFRGCVPQSTHGDAEDSLKQALLGAKEEDEEEKQVYAVRSRKNVSQFPPPSTMCCVDRAVSSTKATPLHVHMAERRLVLEEAQEAQLLCARRALKPVGAPATMTLDRESGALPPDVTTTKSEDAEKGYLQETSTTIANNNRSTSPLVTEELSDQASDRLINETQPAPEKYSGDSVLPDSTADEFGSRRKAVLDLNQHPVEELRTTFVEQLEKQLCSAVPDEIVLPEAANFLSEETCTFRGRCYSSLLNTLLPPGGLDETCSGQTSQEASAAQANALGESCAENGSRKCSFLDGHSVKSAEKPNSLCFEMKSEVSCGDENCASSHHKETRQETPAKLLSPLSPPTLHVKDSAAIIAEDMAPNQEPVTLVQQNASALIKRRRCGSLGLDQSLRWQAMARRVPRIKGVCYSTTRHEWIAVGPLQAGSARKKNIYFSVPKHGFDGARRLAVECRRRLQAGVPVNVQEFVREQQLLFQNEVTASQTEEGTVSASDTVPPAEDMSFVGNHKPLGSPASETLSGNSSLPFSGPNHVVAPQALDCGLPERSSTPAINGRRSQRPQSLTLAPLQRHTTQRLGQGSGGVKECPEESKKQRAGIKQIQRAEDSLQTGRLKARWEGYGTRENSGQVPSNTYKITSESRTPGLTLSETVSEESTIHRNTSSGPGAPTKSKTHGASYSMDVQNKEANSARRRGTYTRARDELMERAFSSDEPGFSTPGRLAKRTRRTAVHADEPASATALLLSDPVTSEGACPCRTERSLQLWASALNHIMQIEEGPTTERGKLRNDSTIASALSAILTQANREKACSPTAACLPYSPSILRSITYSRSTATSPAVHPISPKHSRRPGNSDKGGTQNQRHASFSVADDYGRRSSTTSSAGSRSARVSALSDTHGEHLEYSHPFAKDSSDDSDPSKNPTPERPSSKLWRQETFREEALLIEKLPQFERGRPRKRRESMAEDGRISLTSAISCASQDVGSCGETATAKEICSPTKGRRGLADIFDLSGTLDIPDVTDHIRNGTCTNADGPDTESDVDGSHTVVVNKQSDNAIRPPIPHSATEGTTVVEKDPQGQASLRSLSPGDVFISTSTRPRRASSDCSFASITSALAAQMRGASHVISSRLPSQQNVEQVNFSSQELDLSEEANVGLQLGWEESVRQFDARLPYAGSDSSAVMPDDSGKSGSSDEKLTMTQKLAADFSPLAKALCLMLLDLLRFCSWSPAALTRAGLQPSQIAFCKNEGRQVLRTALQDVFATRIVSPRFRDYIEVFEDSILANALPTSGGAADIMYYLHRVKHLTDGGASPTEQADNEKPAGELCERSGKDSAAGKRIEGCCRGEEETDTNEDSAVLHPKWHTHEIRYSQKRDEAHATIVDMAKLEEAISGLVQGGERDSGGKPGPRIQETGGDEKSLSNFAASSSLSFWYPTQLCAEAEAEQHRCTDEEQFSGGKNGVFEHRCIKGHQQSTPRYAHAAQPNDGQIRTGSVRSSCSHQAAIYAKYFAARGVKDWEKRRITGCPDSPQATCGRKLFEDDDAEHVCELTAPNGKTLPETTETTSYTFQTWRQVIIEALQEAKSFEDLRSSEAMKQLIQLCLPVQSETSI